MSASPTIWLVNHFVPPDPAPTARLLAELGGALQARGWNVRFVGSGSGYRAGVRRGWRRWLRDLVTHFVLFAKGLWGTHPDVILCLTDPPALVFTMACVAVFRRSRLVHWPMDVYPQIAGRLGALGEESFVYRVIDGATRWGLSRCAAVVCLDEDMRQQAGYGAKEGASVIAPWPPAGLAVSQDCPVPKPGLIRWLYSGNLGRAHEFETLLRAQKMLEDQGLPFELVFQGGGVERDVAQRRAADLDLRSCRWLDYAEDEDLVPSLLRAHVVIATQKAEMRGLLWPSKLAVLQALPRPIVWVGPHDGAVAAMLRNQENPAGIFAPGDTEPLARWLGDHASVFRAGAAQSVDSGLIRGKLDAAREVALAKWHGILQGFLAG